MKCVHCDETVEPWEQHPDFMQPMHVPCGFRGIAGSLAHLQHKCSCYVRGSTEHDPPGMTARQAAEAAYNYYREVNGIHEPIQAKKNRLPN